MVHLPVVSFGNISRGTHSCSPLFLHQSTIQTLLCSFPHNNIAGRSFRTGLRDSRPPSSSLGLQLSAVSMQSHCLWGGPAAPHALHTGALLSSSQFLLQAQPQAASETYPSGKLSVCTPSPPNMPHCPHEAVVAPGPQAGPKAPASSWDVPSAESPVQMHVRARVSLLKKGLQDPGLH